MVEYGDHEMLTPDQIIDLSQPLYHNCPSITFHSPPEIRLLQNAAENGWTLEEIKMTTHQGTHMDAPYHLDGYTQTIDQIPIDQMIGRGVFVDLRDHPAGSPIKIRDLESYSSQIIPGSIVLLVTGWGRKRFWTSEWLFNSVWLASDASEWLAQRQVRGVGIDHVSIGGMGTENEETHRKLLKSGIWIIEDMYYPDSVFEHKEWFIFAFPLPLQGTSGSPCRVIAISNFVN
jgi:kynurenine formamidase